nr:MAG TPA: hypothetical protein [Crassvirales sp.]
MDYLKNELQIHQVLLKYKYSLQFLLSNTFAL